MDGTSDRQEPHGSEGQPEARRSGGARPRDEATAAEGPTRPGGECDGSSPCIPAMPPPGLIDVSCLEPAGLPLSQGGNVLLPDDIQAMIVPLQIKPLSDASGRMEAVRMSANANPPSSRAGGWPVFKTTPLEKIAVPPLPDVDLSELIGPGATAGSMAGQASSQSAKGRASSSAGGSSPAASSGGAGDMGAGQGGHREFAPPWEAEQPKAVKTTDIARSRPGSTFAFPTGSRRQLGAQFSTPSFSVVKTEKIPFYQSAGFPPLVLLIVAVGVFWWWIGQDLADDEPVTQSHHAEAREARVPANEKGEFQSPTFKSLEKTWSSSEEKDRAKPGRRRARSGR